MTLRIYWVFTVCIAIFQSLPGQELTSSLNVPDDQCNDIRSYLNAKARELTHRSLQDIDSPEAWNGQRARRHQELLEMLGLQDKPVTGDREPVKVTRTGVIQDEGFRIEKLYYESMPGLYVPANLYIPDGITSPVPAILYVCGHSHTQKHHYQAHARSFAQHGFVCLIFETIQMGEVRGEHLGAESLGWFHWYSRGYNPGGVEVWNGIRGIDLLSQLPEVDATRIGVTGISGGGSQSWYLPAVDARIRASAAVAGAASLEGQVCQRTLDDHCDCMMPLNTYGIDFPDIGALIAPRPFLIAQTTGDGYYSIEAVRALYQKLQPFYRLLGKPDNVRMVEAAGGHSYGANQEFRQEVLAFFQRELMGKAVATGDMTPVDIVQKWTDDELKAYVDGAPEDDLTTTIQDVFVPLAEIPEIETSEQLNTYRDEVLTFLREKTFRAFPAVPTPPDLQLEFQDTDFAPYGRQIYSFVPEEGWRLKFTLRRRVSPDQKAPLLLALVSPGGDRWTPYRLTSGVTGPMNIAFFEARGIGETGWSPALQWHIRRAAAWTGRTIASMRVYDVLRCLEVMRSIPGIDASQIYLAAEGEMAAVASYAALLDGNVHTLILKDPPATQHAASQPDGKGEAIEMLNCLRVTDLPQVTGLMFPRKIVAVGPLPETYRWVEDLYSRLTDPGDYQQVEKLSDWQLEKP